MVHSGLQFGGKPIESIKQEQEAKLLIISHLALGPQGLGEHGFCFLEGISAGKNHLL